VLVFIQLFVTHPSIESRKTTTNLTHIAAKNHKTIKKTAFSGKVIKNWGVENL
jgi:hypothetical protein